MSQECAVSSYRVKARAKLEAGSKLLVTKLYGCIFLPHVEISFYGIKVEDAVSDVIEAVILIAHRHSWFQNCYQTSLNVYPGEFNGLRYEITLYGPVYSFFGFKFYHSWVLSHLS
jgi:hypothetical protein